MLRKNTVLIITALFCFTGSGIAQKLLAKTLGYFKDPRWQSAQTIQAAAESGNAAYDALCYLTSYKDFQYFDSSHLLHFPGVYIFDKNLQPVKVLSGSNCSWQAMEFISTLSDTSHLVTDTSNSLNIAALLQHTSFITGSDAVLHNNDYDYLYLYTWVTYLPKFTKDQFSFSQKIKSNTNKRIKVIALSEDFIANWNANPEQLLGKKVKDITAPENSLNL